MPAVAKNARKPCMHSEAEAAAGYFVVFHGSIVSVPAVRRCF